MPRSDRRDELAEVRERIARAHCDANEDRWVEMQAAMLVYSRSPVEHTILRSRDEHDGVCGLWLLLIEVRTILLIRVESLVGRGYSRVCVCGNGDVQAKLSTAQHTSCQCRRQAELRCRQARACGSALGHGSSRIRYLTRLLFGARSPQITRRERVGSQARYHARSDLKTVIPT
jgi:hypothetical protein